MKRHGRGLSAAGLPAAAALAALPGDARDLEIIERHADELNKEAADALQYQVPR